MVIGFVFLSWDINYRSRERKIVRYKTGKVWDKDNIKMCGMSFPQATQIARNFSGIMIESWKEI
jgi:hypothetical protein